MEEWKKMERKKGTKQKEELSKEGDGKKDKRNEYERLSRWF